LQQTQYPGAFLAKYLSYLAGFIQHAPTANPISLNSGLSLCFLTIVEAPSNVAGVGDGWQPKTCIESPSPVLFYALTLAQTFGILEVPQSTRNENNGEFVVVRTQPHQLMSLLPYC